MASPPLVHPPIHVQCATYAAPQIIALYRRPTLRPPYVSAPLFVVAPLLEHRIHCAILDGLLPRASSPRSPLPLRLSFLSCARARSPVHHMEPTPCSSAEPIGRVQQSRMEKSVPYTFCRREGRQAKREGMRVRAGPRPIPYARTSDGTIVSLYYIAALQPSSVPMAISSSPWSSAPVSCAAPPFPCTAIQLAIACHAACVLRAALHPPSARSPDQLGLARPLGSAAPTLRDRGIEVLLGSSPARSWRIGDRAVHDLAHSLARSISERGWGSASRRCVGRCGERGEWRIGGWGIGAGGASGDAENEENADTDIDARCHPWQWYLA
ncbi:hypothetical protein DFH06DRAFT_1321193 [Mycena polygramma]|nr:hypothetical protein DFH06DRAFT_1321193 [Mycena polygramma]